MNVELPDGTVVEGIPEGITKQDLAKKLQANGMTVPAEWLPKKVGVVESALRTAGSAAKSAVKGFDLAAAGLADIIGWDSERDKIFADMNTRQARMSEAYDPQAGEEFSTTGKVVGAVGSLPQAMAGVVAAGPFAEKSTGVIDRGGSLKEAYVAGGTAQAVDTAMVAAPAALGLKAAQRAGAAGAGATRSVLAGAGTGAAVGAGTGIGARATKNAALPEGKQFDDMREDPFSFEAIMMDAGMGAGGGALAGKTAHTQGKAAAAKRAADAAPAFPSDLKSVGEGEFQTPSGATITKELWENSSKRVRDGWMKAKPVEEKLPTGEAKEVDAGELADTAEVDRVLAKNPEGEVAKVAAEVKAQKQKAAAAEAKAVKDRAAAADMRRIASETKDEALQAALRKRADKLDPPPKIPAGEVIEGQPEIKVKTEAIPAGKTIEGQPEIKTELPDKPLPTGQAKDLYVDPARVDPNAKLPVGETKELGPDALPKEHPPGGTLVDKPLPVGEAKELAPEIPKGEAAEVLPVGEARELAPEVPKGDAAEMLPVGEAREVEGVTPVAKTEPVPKGETKELFVDPKRGGGAPKGRPPAVLDAGLDAYRTASEKLIKATGSVNRGNEIDAEIVRQWGRRRVDTDRAAYLAELTRRTDAEIAKVEADRATKGTLANRRAAKAREDAAQQAVDTMNRADRVEADLAIREAEKLHRQGRLTDADLSEIVDISKTARNPSEIADRMHALGDNKKVPGVEGKVGPDESLDMGLPRIDETFMREQERAQRTVRGPEARATVKPELERGRRQVREALEKGAADGTLNKDGVALATWALDKNPNLARGLRLEGSDKSPTPGAKGSYNSAERVVRLFQGKDNPQTAAHEIFHHSERMMPDTVQAGIRREWRRHIEAETKKASPVVRAVLQDIPRAMKGDAAARARIIKAFEAGVVDAKQHYHLFDPSEFWAVNAARILNDRHASRSSWRTQAKQWVREMIQHVKSTVGIRSDSPVIKALDEALNPSKTTGVDKAGAMIKKGGDDVSLATGPARRALPDETKAELTERKLFDRFNRVAKLQKEAPPKSENADIYQADQLYPGRVQHRGDLLERDYIKPLGKALEQAKKADVTVRDADDYLMALHAPERNAVIAKRNPQMQDGGSGLTNAQAKDIIDSFTPEQRKHLDAVAKIVHDLNRAKMDAMVDDGLISASTRDALNQQYKNYVPLKTLDAESEFTGAGRGYEMRANDITTALGRGSKAGSPIAASVMDASRSVIRGEKARVDRTIWDFAQDKNAHDFVRPYDPKNPPPEVLDRKIGPDGKVKGVVSAQKVQDMTLSLLVNGENVRVFVPDQLLRDQLRKVGSTADPGVWLSTIGRGTATIGRLLTEFNPAFTLPNAVKDAITVGIRAGAHEGVSTAKTVAGIPKAWKSIVDYKRGADTPDAKLYEEFMRTGGKTGAYGIQGVADTMRALEKAGAELGYAEHTGGVTRKTMDVLKMLPKAISSMNEVLEYASRFAAYKQMREGGASPRAAASAAKEITVNFNRSGEYSRAMNSVLVFANAALQGLRNTVVYGKSKHVQRGMLGLVALGAASQAWNEIMGGENEETTEPNINSQNDAVADKNIVVLTPGSRKGFKVPMPPEYALPFTIGRRLYRGISQGNWGKEAAGIAGATLDATLPVRLPEADSSALSVAKAVTPTLASPFVDLWTNQSYFGNPIVPEQHDKRAPAPYHTMSRSTTSELAKTISELANTVTGGDDVKPGLAQRALGPIVSPEGIEHLTKFYTGGAGALVMQGKNMVDAAAKDKPMDTNKLPIANRFIFDEPQSYTSRRYKELAADYEYAKDYRKAEKSGKIDPRVQATLDQYETAEKELRGLFKELREAGAAGADREPIQQRIKAVQSRVIKAFNQQSQ